MIWEDLKVYRKLSKEELKPAFKDFTSIVAGYLKPFGFVLHGRMLIRLFNDLLQVIHLDTRGSWMGISDSFKIEISLVAVSDKSPFIRGFDLTGRKKIEEIAVGIRNYNRITQEYSLLADYLSRKIIESIFPYFEKFKSSVQVIGDREHFKTNYSNDNLILYCELQNKVNIAAECMIAKTLAFYSSIGAVQSPILEYTDELELYKQCLAVNDWLPVLQQLEQNKKEVLKKLKIKPVLK